MGHLILKNVLSNFEGKLAITEKYAASAQSWVTYTYPRTMPQFKIVHRDRFVEMAFFHAFMAWEEFLEEAFTLYLMGKKPPKGKRLYSILPLQTRAHARHILLQGKHYVDWSPCQKIFEHNHKAFRDHEYTYFGSLKSIQLPLDEISIVRNAIAHRSEYSWDSFKRIVRNKFRGAYPSNMSVGSFLTSVIPSSSPPETVLDSYLEFFHLGAELVIPS